MYYIEQFYTRVMLSITYGFKYTITTLPSFQLLTPAINFKSIFMNGIIPTSNVGFLVMNLYFRLGEILKMQLCDTSCISSTVAPKAFEVIQINKHFSGWDILEALLKKRVIACGALPDIDLDKVQSSLHLMKDETYAAFYLRWHQLQSEYELCSKSLLHVPYIKILQIFMTQLLRVQTYVPFLIGYQ